jgi:putative transposase
MPEHVHLLLWPREEVYSISRILASIKQPVARRILNHVRARNPDDLGLFATGQKDKAYRFWLDGGGYDRNITTLNVLRSSLDYIHRNPVRRGLVQTPEQWKWSSFRFWAGLSDEYGLVDPETFPVC